MDPNRSNGKDGQGAWQLTPEDHAEFERGLRFTHVMLTVNQEQSSEAVAFVQALAEVLVQKGILTADELEEPIERARKEVAKVELPHVRLGDIGDKYSQGETVDVDCQSRIHLCRGRCCTLKFFLTKQDLDEGVAKWDYGNPYWILQGEDGRCVHADAVSHFCTIHGKRPHICRKYTCRDDKRIWLDFDKCIPAPLVEPNGNAPIGLAEVGMQNSLRAEREQKAEEAIDQQFVADVA